MEATHHLATIEDETDVASVDEAALRPQEDWERRRELQAKQRELDLLLEDAGRYPTRYRSYAHPEWVRFFDSLETLIAGLDDDDQRRSGVYVEEKSEDFLLIVSKRWTLTIKAPRKSSAAGKTFKVADPKSQWGDQHIETFTDFMLEHAIGPDRDFILDVVCQYEPKVRIRINRRIHAVEHPEDAEIALAEGSMYG